jgi:SET domain-containing protein
MRVYIKSSEQHGKGVFAGEPIRGGEVILTFRGPLRTRSVLQQDEYHLQIGEDLYLGASGDADDYINHSCSPNAGFRDGFTLVAQRDISPDEEITWDYSTAIDEGDFPGFDCCCGAPVCRGKVHSFRHLERLVQEQLKPWLLPYLRAKYFS